MKSNNKTSVKGVSYDKRGGNWVATWQDTEGNQCCKWFASKKYGNDIAKAMAIEYHSRMIRELPHYREALQLDAEA